jgi:flagellar motility protein MotE (MotC chaperone)
MPSSDRSQTRAEHRRRGATRAADAGAREQGAPCNLQEPWDDRAAEALTRLYESDEGRLWQPASGARVHRPAPPLGDPATAEQAEALDRAWLESHLSRLVERLQASLRQASPEPSLAALSSRLEAIEQRFGATLGRVAQRTDLDGLRSIEAHILDLGAQLERARERLEQIGAVDEQLRALARKLDEAGEQRTGTLERLLRDAVAEWRESEQRTAGALRSIDEAVNRLGDAVDAMEASKPAPDLTLPPLAGPEPGRVDAGNGSRAHPDDDRRLAPQLYQPMLDAADYVPRSVDGMPRPGPRAAEAFPARNRPAVAASEVEWPAALGPDRDAAGAGPRLTPGALRIMALRAKLRQPPAGTDAPSHARAAGAGEQPGGLLRRASFSLLLLAACVVGGAYLLYQTFVAPAPASPFTIERGAHPGQVSGIELLEAGALGPRP